MEVETCKHEGKMTLNTYTFLYESSKFPDGNTLLQWDILYDNRPQDKRYFCFRSKSAPLGEIIVHFRVRFYGDDNSMEPLTGHFRFESKDNNIPDEGEMVYGAVIPNFLVPANFKVDVDIFACYLRQKLDSTLQESESFQNYARYMLESIHADPKFSDVEIQIGETHLKAHKNILAVVSPVFRATLTTDMLEKNSGCIKINDVKPEIIILMLEYIYEGCIALANLNDAIELLRVSDIYAIETLRRFCTTYIKRQINQDNIVKILIASELYNAEDLREVAMDYFEKTPVAYKAEDFQDMLKSRPNMFPVLLEKLSRMRINNE